MDKMCELGIKMCMNHQFSVPVKSWIYILCWNSEQYKNVICLQSLKEEFKQQEDLLKELDQHAKDYKLQGKLEAGARLEQQIQLLKVVGHSEIINVNL